MGLTWVTGGFYLPFVARQSWLLGSVSVIRGKISRGEPLYLEQVVQARHGAFSAGGRLVLMLHVVQCSLPDGKSDQL